MKSYLGALLLGFLLVGCGSNNDLGKTETPQDLSGPIVIGAVAPLTGDAAIYGKVAQNTINLKLEQFNTAGGLNGRKVELIWEDGKCNPNDSSKAAQKLMNVDKVSIILSGECSGGTLGMAPLTEKNGVLLFSVLSSNPSITNAGDLVFRTAPSDSSQGKVLGEYAQNKGYKKVGLLSEQTDYSIGVAGVFEQTFQGEVVREDYLSSETDFKTRITKLKAAGIEALFINPQSPVKGEIILKQLSEQEVKLPILTNEVVESSIATTESFKDYFRALPDVVGGSFVAPEGTVLSKLISDYETKYSEKPDFANYAGTSADGFDTLMWAIGQAGNEKEVQKIKQALYDMPPYEGGVYKGLRFDANGDVNITHSLFRFDGEKFAPLSE